MPGAQKFGLLHPRHGLQFRLDDSDHVVSDLVWRQRIAVEAQVHPRNGIADLHGDDRLLGTTRQLIQYRIDLGVDLRKRPVGIVIEAQRCGDSGNTVAALRSQVVDPLCLGHGGLDRSCDEASDEICARAVVLRTHRDRGILSLGKLAYR